MGTSPRPYPYTAKLDSYGALFSLLSAATAKRPLFRSAFIYQHTSAQVRSTPAHSNNPSYSSSSRSSITSYSGSDPDGASQHTLTIASIATGTSTLHRCHCGKRPTVFLFSSAWRLWVGIFSTVSTPSVSLSAFASVLLDRF